MRTRSLCALAGAVALAAVAAPAGAHAAGYGGDDVTRVDPGRSRSR